MKNYLSIPDSVDCKPCKACGSRPVIMQFNYMRYVVKCPNDSSHYQTQPGLIDIEDWNRHNMKTVFLFGYRTGAAMSGAAMLAV